MNGKPIYVAFYDKKLEDTYEQLQKEISEQKHLYKFITRAINDLKKDPMCGIKIPRRLWPQRYIRKFHMDNLWKYDLPNAWRLMYTIAADQVKILNIILEWHSHKEYERLFGY